MLLPLRPAVNLGCLCRGSCGPVTSLHDVLRSMIRVANQLVSDALILARRGEKPSRYVGYGPVRRRASAAARTLADLAMATACRCRQAPSTMLRFANRPVGTPSAEGEAGGRRDGRERLSAESLRSLEFLLFGAGTGVSGALNSRSSRFGAPGRLVVVWRMTPQSP